MNTSEKDKNFTSLHEEQRVNTHLVGFRKWAIDPKNKLLTGLNANSAAWQPELNYALGCSTHSSPGKHCHCGFNAWYSLDDADGYGTGILGAIAGAGEVRVHEKGFRSEQAQVLALFLAHKVTRKDEELIQEIASRYGVPLFTDETEFIDFVEQFHTLPEDFNTRDELKEMTTPRFPWIPNFLVGHIRYLLIALFVFLSVVAWGYIILEGTSGENRFDHRPELATVALLQDKFYKENGVYAEKIKDLVPKESLNEFMGLNLKTSKDKQEYTLINSYTPAIGSNVSYSIIGTPEFLSTSCVSDSSELGSLCSGFGFSLLGKEMSEKISRLYKSVSGENKCFREPFFRSLTRYNGDLVYKPDNKC